jgi:hypothetical protein
MGAVAGDPKGQSEQWLLSLKAAEHAMRSLYHNGQFTNLGHQEARVRFGIGFGERGAVRLFPT